MNQPTPHLQPVKRAIRRLGKNNIERARRFGWHPRTLYRFQSGHFDKIIAGLIRNPDVLLELALYAQRIQRAATQHPASTPDAVSGLAPGSQPGGDSTPTPAAGQRDEANPGGPSREEAERESTAPVA